MNKKTSLLLCALLLGATASPSAIAGTMVLDSFAEETGPIDEAVDKVLMATVNTSGQQGGNDASDTTVSIGGSVLAADIGEVCVNYGGVEISCQVNPGSTTNIVLTLPGNQKGGSPFTYHVTLNTSAAGKDITLTVEAIGNTNLTDNIGLPRTTTPRTVFSSAGVAPTVDTPTSGTPTYDNPTWSADLGGTVSDAGTPSTLSSCGVDWGTAPADPPTTPYPNSVPGGVPCSGTGDAFTVNVSGLPSSATIYFRPWADNGLRGYSTTEGQLVVPAPPSAPLVSTRPVDLPSVTQNSAILGGDVTDDGNAAITERGIYWRDGQAGAENGTKVPMALGTGTGEYFEEVNGLPAGANIYYRAYAINAVGEALGAEPAQPFTTLAGLATVTTAAEASVTATTAVLGGEVTNDGGAAITDQGIVWSTTPLPQVGVDTTVQMGTLPEPFSDTVGDLSPASDVALPTGQLVYFRAYATNAEGTAYGNQRSFTPAGPPELTALPADNVTLYSGTMHGRLDNDGGNTLTDCGIAWGNTSGGPYPNLESVGLCTAGVPFEVILSTLPGTTVYYKAYATNDLAQTTLSEEPAVTSGQESFTTPSEPTVQASNVTFPQESGAAMRISWTRGNGTGVIVVMRVDDPNVVETPRVDPQDGDDYLGESDFSAPPPELPTNSDNFVVYKGSAGGVLVNGLAPNTAYSVVVYEYTGTGASTDYLLADAPSATNTGTHSTTDVPVHNMDFGVNCDQCHNHGSFGTNGDPNLIVSCQYCHSLGQVAQNRREFSNHVTPRGPSPAKGPHPDGLTYVDCGMCHELHNPGGDNTTLSYNPLTGQTTYNKSFLRSNVSKYVPGAVDGAFLHNDQPLREAGNDSGYPETPFDTPERAVENGTDAVDPISATQARGYCQVCHTYTNYHTNNPSVSNSDQCHDGQTGNCGPTEAHCGECHEHNDTFKGKGGATTCMVCHAVETDLGLNTRREVMTEFDHPRPGTQTPGDPDESSHIYAGSSAILEPDCLVCHAFDESHQLQKVTLYDLDDSPILTPRTTYAQTDDEQSAQIPAQGAPLSQHCFSCHEDGTPAFLAGSVGDQTQNSPFIDSNPAPIMSDAGLWTGASHNDGATIGCVGCHVGHGSTRHSLLDPDPPAFPAGADPSNFETDFCINCHDADGPSAKDISADLNYETQETTNSKNSSAFVNNRHDLRADDQAASTASIDCKDCHSPHADTQANPVRNPDDGSLLPLYDFALGSLNGSAYSSATDTSDPCTTTGDLDPLNPLGNCNQGYTEPDMISFCVACHDNTLPAGTGATFATAHPPPTNMEEAYFTNRVTDYHGGNVNSDAGQGMLKYPWNVLTGTGVYGMPPGEVGRPYAAMNCTTCHDAHGSGNIFNLRTSITVAGVPMQTGGWSGDTIGATVTTDYLMPDTDGDPNNGVHDQEAFYWGAWCSFCHWMESHGRSETAACNTGHRHMGGNF